MKGFKNQPVENSNTDVMNSRNPQLRPVHRKAFFLFYSEKQSVGGNLGRKLFRQLCVSLVLLLITSVG
mgnify:CR=1 FL=1